MSKRVLFIDRDGTLIKEAPPTYQLDSFNKLRFYPHVFEYMRKIRRETDYELVMVTNQDGLGTDSFPEENFQPVHELIMTTLEHEDIVFDKVFIDKTFPWQNIASRKPGTGMLTEFIGNTNYDLPNSFVIGGRITDMQLAKNLGCKGIWLCIDEQLGSMELTDTIADLKKQVIVLQSPYWKDIYEYLCRL